MLQRFNEALPLLQNECKPSPFWERRGAIEYELVRYTRGLKDSPSGLTPTISVLTGGSVNRKGCRAVLR